MACNFLLKHEWNWWRYFSLSVGVTKLILCLMLITLGSVVLHSVSGSTLGISILIFGIFGTLESLANVYFTLRIFEMLSIFENTFSAHGKKLYWLIQLLVSLVCVFASFYLLVFLSIALGDSMNSLDTVDSCRNSEFSILYLVGQVTCEDCLQPIEDHLAVYTDALTSLGCSEICGDCRREFVKVLVYAQATLGVIFSLIILGNVLSFCVNLLVLYSYSNKQDAFYEEPPVV